MLKYFHFAPVFVSVWRNWQSVSDLCKITVTRSYKD